MVYFFGSWLLIEDLFVNSSSICGTYLVNYMIYCALGIPFIIQRVIFEEKTIPHVNKACTMKLVCHSFIKYLGFLFWLISWVNTMYSLVAMLMQRNVTNNG